MLHALMIFQAVVSILLIILVLLQFGKGAEAGLISGGGGASDAAFSSAQRGNILTKITTVLAIIFLAGAVNLARMQSKGADKSLFDNQAPVAMPLNRDQEPAATPVAPEKK